MRSRRTQSLPSVASQPPLIAVVCPRLEGGGAERVMLMLASELSARFRVDFVTRDRQLAQAAQLAPTVRIVDLGARSLAPLMLARYYARERPTAVLATLVGPNALAVAVARTLPSATRPRVVVREAHMPSAHLPFRPAIDRWAVPLVTRFAYPRADAIVALTESARADLALALPPGAPIHVIPNPIDLARVAAYASESVDDPRFGPDRAAPTLVAVGRLVVKKGFDVLLHAFAELRRQRSASLTILGEGPERSHLEALARSLAVANDVAFIGYQKNPFKYLARADLFVLSSRAEGMPNALIEALACGTPVVATDCPSGPRELLAGLPAPLVPVGDAGSLARAVCAGLKTPPDRVALRRAVASHDLAVVARAYAELLVPDIARAPRL